MTIDRADFRHVQAIGIGTAERLEQLEELAEKHERAFRAIGRRDDDRAVMAELVDLGYVEAAELESYDAVGELADIVVEVADKVADPVDDQVELGAAGAPPIGPDDPTPTPAA